MNPKVVPKFKAEKSLLVPRKYDMTVGKFITRPTIKEFLNNNYEFKKKPGSRTIFLRENTPFHKAVELTEGWMFILQTHIYRNVKIDIDEDDLYNEILLIIKK